MVQTTVHGQALAPDEEDKRALLQSLHAATSSQQVALWGYAFLERELHLLVQPPDAQALGRAMQTLGRRYVPASTAATDAGARCGPGVSGPPCSSRGRGC